MAQKPSIPKGTRDFSPLEMMRRQYIFDKIRDVFRTFGFGPVSYTHLDVYKRQVVDRAYTRKKQALKSRT